MVKGRRSNKPSTVSASKVMTIKHQRAFGYNVYVCNGASVAMTAGNRVEITFFADRTFPDHEGLVFANEEKTQAKADGVLNADPIREHVTAVNMAPDDLVAIMDLIKKTIGQAAG